MKKILMFACIFCLSFMPFVFAGCEKVSISSVSIVESSIDAVIFLNETLNTNNAQAKVTWSDGKTKIVDHTELTFGEINTSTTGEKELSVTFEDYTFTFFVTVKVKETEIKSVIGFESQLLTSFASNSSEKDESQKNEEFMDRDQKLFVGDDNNFHLDILAAGRDTEGALHDNLKEVETNITVELKNGDSFELLEGEALAEYVEVDNMKNTFDFTSNAIGEDFKITLTAVKAAADFGVDPIEATVSVIDAYNIYEAYELSLYDNHNANWNSFREEKNINQYAENISGFVLQRKIEVTKDDVLDSFFWKKTDNDYAVALSLTDQEVEGSLKDATSKGIYHRIPAKNETFTFVGNYFSIDVSNFPHCVVEATSGAPYNGINVKGSEMMTTHISLFYTNYSYSTGENKPNHSWKNIDFIGNATLSSDVVYSGGIILSKMNDTNFSTYNTIMNDFYIGYFFEKYGEFHVDSCKASNSFQTFMYCWHAEHVLLENSTYLDCGGPAIISDNSEDNISTNLDIVNCEIRALVSGEEPYFAEYEGSNTAIADIIQADPQLYSEATLQTVKASLQQGLDKNYGGAVTVDDVFDYDFTKETTIIAKTQTVDTTDVQYINFMVFMNGDDTSFESQCRINGYTRIFETKEEFDDYYANDNTSVTYGLDYYDTSLKNKSLKGITFFESAKTGGYMGQNGDTNIAEKCYWDADYINIYTGLGLGAVVQAYQPISAD